MTHIFNAETQKLELHFTKEEYDSLSEPDKAAIKSAFLWSRSAGAWVSRAKNPNLYTARRIAQQLNSEDGGITGEKLTFAQHQAQKQERAEARAERYEQYAENAQARGDQLQKPINHMHGDIAFFTQPNINTSAGRAFTNRRNRMFAAFDKGMEEYKKSEYFKERARVAKATADSAKPADKGFIDRRIKEAERDIRQCQKHLETADTALKRIEAGETLTCYDGTPFTLEQAEKNVEHYLDLIDTYTDKLAYYQSCMDELGGVAFSKANVHIGDVVKMERWGLCKVIGTGPKFFTWTDVQERHCCRIKSSYAEIVEAVTKAEKQGE
jgi:hypothetical protein